jgi:prepilin-type N-terminal cleavage/methylation domain-containing protein
MKKLIDNIKGVTLIELIIVLTIVAIGAAIAVPGMGAWLAKGELNSASRRLASDLNLTRSEAIKRNANVSMRIITATPFSYSVGTSGAGSPLNNIIPNVNINRNISFRLFRDSGTGTEITDNPTTTGFDARGISTRPISIQVTSSRAPTGSNRKTVVISFGGSVLIQ